jgi:hypothetical protein
MIVYFFQIPHRHQYWVWHSIYLELMFEMESKFNAQVVKSIGEPLYIEKFDHYVSDCEILIYDEVNDILRAITFVEGRRDLVELFQRRNNPNDILLFSQVYNNFPRDFDFSTLDFKFKPTPYYPFMPHADYDFFYKLRKLKDFDELRNQMFLLYTTDRCDTPKLRELGVCSPNIGLIPIEQYLDYAITHKVGLSIPGIAEICHREIEYMAIGLPTLRLEYMTQLNPPLIPNYHYISIDRSEFAWDSNADRLGGDKYIEAYTKRFNEVKDDKEFLDFIAKNGREYYENYCSPNTRLKHILFLLEL